MFSAVVGWFSQDLAIDLGTSNTRFFIPGESAPTIEPTVVAVQTNPNGRRSLIAIGQEAQIMLGRTPPEIKAVQPVRKSHIENFEVAEALIVHLMRQAHGRNKWIRPRMVVTLPSHANEMECRAVRKCCESAGAREVHIIPTPVAAAVGAGLPIEEPAGHMIVDVGGGSTTISIVSLKGIVHSVTCPGGGEGIDRDILNHLREQHGLLVGLTTVEQLKWQIAGNASDTHSDSRPVKGRCMKSGVPKAVNVTRSEILTAIHGSIENIGTHILRTLESSPPELASDVVDHGAILVGGGSRLSGLEGHLRNQTSLTIVRAEEPETAAVMGAGTILEDHELLHSIQFG